MTSSQELSDLMVTAYNYQKQGKFSSAIQSWNALVKHKSAGNDLKASTDMNLGYLHQQQGNFDLVHESMASANEANLNSAEAYYCLAYMEQQKKNFNMVIEYLE
jgi:tetratricopeptide (TPR) repeat protein